MTMMTNSTMELTPVSEPALVRRCRYFLAKRGEKLLADKSNGTYRITDASGREVVVDLPAIGRTLGALREFERFDNALDATPISATAPVETAPAPVIEPELTRESERGPTKNVRKGRARCTRKAVRRR